MKRSTLLITGLLCAFFMRPSPLPAQERIFEIAAEKQLSSAMVEYYKRELSHIQELAQAEQVIEYWKKKHRRQQQRLKSFCESEVEGETATVQCLQSLETLDRQQERELEKMKRLAQKNPILAKMVFRAQAQKNLQKTQELINVLGFFTRYSLGERLKYGPLRMKNERLEEGYFWTIDDRSSGIRAIFFPLALAFDLVFWPQSF